MRTLRYRIFSVLRSVDVVPVPSLERKKDIQMVTLNAAEKLDDSGVGSLVELDQDYPQSTISEFGYLEADNVPAEKHRGAVMTLVGTKV